MPTQLPTAVADLVHARGLDLEHAGVVDIGSRRLVKVVVDAESGVEADTLAQLSRAIEAELDDDPDFGGEPYTLEVTTRGVDEPLVLQRHWSRAQGRMVKIDLADGHVVGRIGRLDGNIVDVIVSVKRNLEIQRVDLTDVRKAVVQVEFSPPNSRELDLAGGVVGGRPVPGGSDAQPVDLDSTPQENDK